MEKEIFKPALIAAVILGLLGVLLGALGAHALQPPVLSDKIHEDFETAVRYQFYHCFALFFTAILYIFFPGKWIKRATGAFITGVILFSGSIYLMTYLQSGLHIAIPTIVGVLTPLGGLCLISGWLFLLIGINSRKQKVKGISEK